MFRTADVALAIDTLEQLNAGISIPQEYILKIIRLLEGFKPYVNDDTPGVNHKAKVIISAYTGVLMCDFSDMHKYIEEKLGRPVSIRELMSDLVIMEEIREVVKDDFMALCDPGLQIPFRDGI